MGSLRNKINKKGRVIGELEKSSLVLFVIMMAGNFLNYLFQIIMGNKLSVEDYGTLSALLSIIAILSVVSLIITTVCARYTVHYREDSSRIRHLVFIMLKVVAISATIIIIVGILCAPWISLVLKIKSSQLIIYTLIVTAVSMFTSVVLGILQGLKRFFDYGTTNFIAIAGKLVFSLILVALGVGLFGPLTAIMLGMILATGYGLYHIRDKIKYISSDPLIFDWKDFFCFTGKVLLIQVCISLITNGDILLVKYFFSPQDAGLYSSAMVIGKISLYAATAIVAALYPMTMEQVAKGHGAKRLLYKSLLYSGGLALCCALVLNVFSGLIIRLLYGQQYASSAALLLPISAFVIPVTLYTIMMNYQLATGQIRSLSLTLISSIIICGVLVQFLHQSIEQMIYCIALVLIAGVFVDLLIVIFSDKKIINQKQNTPNESIDVYSE